MTHRCGRSPFILQRKCPTPRYLFDPTVDFLFNRAAPQRENLSGCKIVQLPVVVMLQSKREEKHFSGFQRIGQTRADRLKKVLAGRLEVQRCTAKVTAREPRFWGFCVFIFYQGNKSPVRGLVSHAALGKRRQSQDSAHGAAGIGNKRDTKGFHTY